MIHLIITGQTMTRIAVPFFYFLIVLSSIQPSSSQPVDIPSNKIIEQLSRAGDDLETVKITGFVLATNDKIIKVYEDLSLRRYYEVARSDIVYFSPEEKSTDPAHVFVNAKASVLQVTKGPVRDLAGSARLLENRSPLSAETLSRLSQSPMFRSEPPLQPSCVFECLGCGVTLAGCAGCAYCFFK